MGNKVRINAISFLIGASIFVLATTPLKAENVAEPPAENASCYPGLPCPGGQGSENRANPQGEAHRNPAPAQRSQGSFGQHFHYVGQVNPPDPWLALRTEPSSKRGRRIMKMPQGTLLRQLERRGFWWRVELTTGERGWAHSKWIKCCKTLND